jgi:hypothetical protein
MTKGTHISTPIALTVTVQVKARKNTKPGGLPCTGLPPV